MRSRDLRLAVFLLLFLLPGSAVATERELTYEADTTIGLFRTRVGYHPGFFFGMGGLGVGFGRVLSSLLEATARLQFEVYNDNGDAPGGMIVNAQLGPTFNFGGSGISDEWFVSLGAGLNYSQKNSFTVPGTLLVSDSQNQLGFAYSASFGKRFALLPNVSWKPQLAVSGYTGDDIFRDNATVHPTFAIVPLAFAVVF